MNSSLALLNILKRFYMNATDAEHSHLPSEKQLSGNSEAGFTLIELIVVIIIIGVLSAIIAPGWLAFTNQQRVSKVNDAILSALQTAQAEAKRSKLSYSASFKFDKLNPTDADSVPLFAVYPSSSTPTTWQKLGGELELKPGSISLCSNVDQRQANNIKATSYCNSATPSTISFNYQGILIAATAAGSDITVTGQNGNPKRCVVVKTILGSMQIEKDNQCP